MRTPSKIVTPCTVTPRVAAADPDEYNDEVLVDGTPVDTLCWHHPTQRAEDIGTANTVTETETFYFLPDVAVDGHAVVSVGGRDYELEPPAVWPHPVQGDVFQTATAKRIT